MFSDLNINRGSKVYALYPVLIESGLLALAAFDIIRRMRYFLNLSTIYGSSG